MMEAIRTTVTTNIFKKLRLGNWLRGKISKMFELAGKITGRSFYVCNGGGKIGKGQTKDKKHPSIQAAQVQRAHPPEAKPWPTKPEPVIDQTTPA
jgi:predicted RNA-binding protein YlxR (DUF448 family)